MFLSDKGKQSLAVAVDGPLVVDDVPLLIRATVDGVGLTFLMEEQAAPYLASGALVRVLEDWCEPFAGHFLYYPRATRSTRPSCAAAIRDERKLRLAYRDDEGRQTTPVVWPLAIGFYDRLRILVAWCELCTDFRHFRTDRIESADRLDVPLPRSRHDLLRKWRAQEAAAEPPV
jgi:hypothetical protein